MSSPVAAADIYSLRYLDDRRSRSVGRLMSKLALRLARLYSETTASDCISANCQLPGAALSLRALAASLHIAHWPTQARATMYAVLCSVLSHLGTPVLCGI